MGVATDKYSCYAALLNQCDKEIEILYHNYALKYNLSDAALWILYAICESKDHITQSDLCSYWFFSRQTINSALKGLVKQGVIELIAIPGNRKSKNIVCTESGRAMVERIISPLKQAENHVFAAMSAEENEQFVELTQKRCSLLRRFLEAE